MLSWILVLLCPNDGYCRLFSVFMYEKPKNLNRPKMCTAGSETAEKSKGTTGKRWQGNCNESSWWDKGVYCMTHGSLQGPQDGRRGDGEAGEEQQRYFCF